MDASIMYGKTLNAGAIAGVKTIKNPILLARLVMDMSPHVFLYGDGAEKFAQKFKLETRPQSYFITDRRKKGLEKYKNIQKTLKKSIYKYGTVGVVALDKKGDLVGATSTGGMTGKMYGRIGDTPIIGAGTYANNATCAVSCTGSGEFFIRSAAAYTVSALMEFNRETVQQAAKVTIGRIGNIGGSGGLIALDKDGNVAMEFNTDGMYRAYRTSEGKKYIQIYK